MADNDEKSKDQLYKERNQAFKLAAALANRNNLRSDVGYRIDEEEGDDWPVLVINHRHLGEMAFHLPEDELPDIFEEKDVKYDSHSTEEKLDRMERWISTLDNVKINAYPVAFGVVAGGIGGAIAAGPIGALLGVGFGWYAGATSAVYELYSENTETRGAQPIHRRLWNAITLNNRSNK